MKDGKKPNKLIDEKSPYLLQHAYNLIDWYPWGEEAFENARSEDKPIFLSIGYSTCHWCHVMEHESFEDSVVAQLMNEVFISIKVDREERPDIDNIYMTVCQMLTGSGGWPLTIIMTPDKKPFFAGTYFPKEERFGRMGMIELTRRINEAWKNNRDKIYESADNVSLAVSEVGTTKGDKEIDEEVLRSAFKQLNDRYDRQSGGFGTSPKFPSPHNLTFLLRYWNRTGDNEALQMVESTLSKMYIGGIYDHVGFGFHRYSTDREWLVPHFEKMLYDQALLLNAYTEAYQATGNEKYSRIAEEIITYVLRDMTSTEGGFYSAEDADSEGEEGKFYLWSIDEVGKILDEESAQIFIEVYNLQSAGNYVDEMTKSKNGKNIPHLGVDIHVIAEKYKIQLGELNEKLSQSRKKIFEARKRRVHPYKDDKILTDWNGLMIASLAKASRILGKVEYAEAAIKAMNFIMNDLRLDNGRLIHRYRDGEAGLTSNVDDYAFIIWGSLELYETTFRIEYLERAIELQELQLLHFWDAQNFGFFFTPDDGEKLLTRTKEIYDGAIPSGNSVSLLNLLKLSRLTSETKYEEFVSKMSMSFSEQVINSPSGSTMMLQAVDFAIGPSYEVLISSDNKEAKETMLNALNRLFIPNKVVLLQDKENKTKLESTVPFAQGYEILENEVLAYVCQNFVCNLPTNDPAKFRELLMKKGSD
jgi:uncharacterized protein YyaL (SSP411 family)